MNSLGFCKDFEFLTRYQVTRECQSKKSKSNNYKSTFSRVIFQKTIKTAFKLQKNRQKNSKLSRFPTTPVD